MASDFNAIEEEYYSLLREREDLVRKIERSQDQVWVNHCQSRVRQIEARMVSLKPAIEAEKQRRAAERDEK